MIRLNDSLESASEKQTFAVKKSSHGDFKLGQKEKFLKVPDAKSISKKSSPAKEASPLVDFPSGAKEPLLNKEQQGAALP